MDETCAHILDPIPDEQYLEARDATGGKPAGVRFLAFNTIIDIEAYGEAAACRAAFEEARALCRLYERLFSRTLPHSDIARINSAHGQPVAIDPLTYAREGAFLLRGKRGRLRHYRRPGGAPVEFSRGHSAR